MYFIGVVAFTVLYLIEYNILTRLFYKGKELTSISAPPAEEGIVDDDVQIEKDRVAQMDASQIQYNHLLFKDLTKYYGKFLAVNQVSLAVDRKECFGLLGVNGAGKTTLFKMLTGEELISFGKGFVQGASIKSSLIDVYNKIGYCPQDDALHEDLTGREILYLFSLFRGIPKPKIDIYIRTLSAELFLDKDLDKQVKHMSGGTKRKMNAAVALIGTPSVVYLDEPTTGLDPLAKRCFWATICQIRDQGKTIVLSSHSIEEAETLCTRIAIMVNGEFKCLGSVQHLKNKFSQGFVITLKCRNRRNETVKEWMNQNFSNAELR